MSPPTPPTIAHPLRILYLSPPDTPTSKPLEGDNLPLSTPYYTALIPLWHDTLPSTPPSLSQWRTEWLAPEAREVVASIGAWVIGARKPTSTSDLDTLRELLNTIKEVIEHHTGEVNYGMGNDALLLLVGLPQPLTPRLEMGAEEWEDWGRECGGWEWVDGEVEGDKGERNDFGEKVGLARLVEALEAHEWEDGAAEELPRDLDLAVDDDGLPVPAAGFGDEELGAREPILHSDDRNSRPEEDGIGEEEDVRVEELESMMLKMQAIKDMGADMPETERKRFAAKAVRDVMRKL